MFEEQNFIVYEINKLTQTTDLQLIKFGTTVTVIKNR